MDVVDVVELVVSVGVVARRLVAFPCRPVCHGVDLPGQGRGINKWRGKWRCRVVNSLIWALKRGVETGERGYDPGSSVHDVKCRGVGTGFEDTLNHLFIFL